MNVTDAVSFDFSHESIRLAYTRSGGAESLSLEASSSSASLSLPAGDFYDPNGAQGLAATLATPEGIVSFLEEKVMGRLRAHMEEAVGPKAKAPQPLDRSPEATAGRIVRFATGFYGAYADQNGDTPETLDDFLEIVEGAIGEGFAQAVAQIGMTSGSEPGEVSRTRELVKDYLEEFRRERLVRLEGREAAA